MRVICWVMYSYKSDSFVLSNKNVFIINNEFLDSHGRSKVVVVVVVVQDCNSNSNSNSSISNFQKSHIISSFNLFICFSFLLIFYLLSCNPMRPHTWAKSNFDWAILTDSPSQILTGAIFCLRGRTYYVKDMVWWHHHDASKGIKWWFRRRFRW